MGSEVILMKIQRGEIVLSDLENIMEGPGHSSLAIRVIGRISVACGHSAVDEKEVFSAIELSLKAIQVDCEQDPQLKIEPRAIPFMYNVLLFFFKKENHTLALRILEHFLPIVEGNFVSSGSVQEKMSKLASFCANIIFVSVQKMDSGAFNQPAGSYLLDLWNLVAKVCRLENTCTLVPFSVSFLKLICTKALTYIGSKSKREVIVFYENLFEKFTSFCKSKSISYTSLDASIDQMFSNLIFTIWDLFQFSQKADLLTAAHRTLMSLSGVVSLLFREQSQHMESYKLFVRVLKFFFPEKIRGLNQKKFVSEVNSLLEILRSFETDSLSRSSECVIFIIGKAICLGVKAAGSLPASDLIIYHRFIKLASSLLLLCSVGQCITPSGETCPCKFDFELSFGTSSKFIELCIDYQKSKEQWVEVWPMVQDSLVMLVSVIKKASERNCFRKQVFKKTLEKIHLQIGRLCFKAEDWENAKIFYLSSMKTLFEDIEKDSGTVSENQLNQWLFSSSKLSVCFEKLELRKEARAAVLLSVVLLAKSKKPLSAYSFVHQQWSSLQNEDLSNAKSVYKFLQQETTLLQSICPIEFSAELLPDLMLWELSCYALYRINDTKIIMNAWLALSSLKPAPVKLIQGSALLCKALFSSSDLVEWTSLLSLSPLSWLKGVQQNQEKAVAFCAMAVYCQVKFLILAQKQFDECESAVVDTPTLTNPNLVKKHNEVLNPSDVCAIKSISPNVNLEQEQSLMNILDDAVSYWAFSLEIGLSKEDNSSYAVVAYSGDYLLQTAFAFMLWGHHEGAVRTWHICCKFARQTHQDDLLLQGLLGLMNTVQVEQSLIDEADKLLKSLEDHPKHHFFCKWYCSSKANQLLLKGEFHRGIQTLKDVLHSVPTITTVWCFAQAKLLQALYGLLPNSIVDKKELGDKDVMTCARAGLEQCIVNTKAKRLSPSTLIFLANTHQTLSISLWIGRYYKGSKMPREARYYLKAELTLALKLGLTTRSVEFLCELAFVDLLAEKLDDASWKVLQIRNILEGDKSSVNSPEVLTQDTHSGRWLQVPNANSPLASPNLQGEVVVRVPFISHDSACKCYPCTNCNLQNIWLMYCHLTAKLEMLNFHQENANKIFNSTLKYAHSIIKNISPNASMLLKHKVECTRVSLRLDFVDMLFMYEKDDAALKKNGRTIELLKSIKTHESYLLNEALEQKNSLESHFFRKTQGSGFHLGQSDAVQTPMESSRTPLKLLKTPNQLLTPLSDQHFITPKGATDAKQIIADIDNHKDIKKRLTSMMQTSDSSKAGARIRKDVSPLESSGRKQYVGKETSGDDKEPALKISSVSKNASSTRKKRVEAKSGALSAVSLETSKSVDEVKVSRTKIASSTSKIPVDRKFRPATTARKTLPAHKALKEEEGFEPKRQSSRLRRL